MIPYHKITLEDQEWMTEKLRESGFRGSEYCFANQFLWGKLADMEAAEVEGFLCTEYGRDKQTAVHDFPAGKGDRRRILQKLLEDDGRRGKNTVFRGVLTEEKLWLEENFPGCFQFETDRNEWDYLYFAETLKELKGKQFHGKRNHISRFQSNGEWKYEDMNPEHAEECLSMYRRWMKDNASRLDASVEKEKRIVEGCFQNFAALALCGGVLRQEGAVVAFCIGGPLTEDTYIVHIEKAYTHIQGAYPMINQQFVLHNMEGYRYVNREDDLGLEGLRKAKLSYYPELLEKYHAKPLDGGIQ